MDQHTDIIELQGELHNDIEELKSSLKTDTKKKFARLVTGVIFEMGLRGIIDSSIAQKVWQYIMKGGSDLMKLLTE